MTTMTTTTTCPICRIFLIWQKEQIWIKWTDSRSWKETTFNSTTQEEEEEEEEWGQRQPIKNKVTMVE